MLGREPCLLFLHLHVGLHSKVDSTAFRAYKPWGDPVLKLWNFPFQGCGVGGEEHEIRLARP